MTPARATWCWLTLAALLVALAPARALASGDPEEARAFFDKATAAFALGRYGEAAESFEKAFESKPDSALLFNAAQAHRLAGNKARALTLYQNYLRIYPKAPKRAEVSARVEELKRAIELDRLSGSSPAAATAPAVAPSTPDAPPPSAPAPSAPPVAEASPAKVDLRAPGSAGAPPVMVTRPGDQAASSITDKPLFWVGVAGAIAVLTTVVLVVALSGDQSPAPSLGTVR